MRTLARFARSRFDAPDRYRDQLNRYARFVSSLDSRPIRLGLYHPLLRGWSEWRYEPSDQGTTDPKIG